jgi:predicted MFS family arabinose efflux permease
MISRTRWPLVWMLIFAGVLGAFQVGKAAIAVPLLRDDLGLSLSFASWVVSIFAVIGAIGGLPAGLGIKVLGGRVAIVGGLLTIGIASCVGALASGGLLLMVTRTFEGLGFLMVVIGAPTLLRAVTAMKDLDLVFGCWTVYYATGSVIIMLAGPLLTEFGWQGLWWGTGIVALGYAVVVWLVAPHTSESVSREGRPFADVGLVLRSPGPMLLALTFGFYTFQYHALSALMPTLLVDRLGLSIGQAGALTAATIVANGFGSISVGWLLARGVRLWVMVATAFACVGLTAFGIFAQSMPVVGVVLLAAASLGFTGLVPGLVYVAAPRFTPHPALLVLTLGVVVQASNLGALIGPAVLGNWVERFGWSSAPALFAAIACIGLSIAVGIRRLGRNSLSN